MMGSSIQTGTVIYPELLPVLVQGGDLLDIPTDAGWTEVVVGSGASTQLISLMNVYTGVTASSSALLRTLLGGFNASTTEVWQINWAKKLYFIFSVMRLTSEVETTARIQIKSVSTIGQLAAKGIELKIANLALWGESYGSALGQVNLATNLTSGLLARIVIIHDPATPKIEWYVNGVLKGTQTTAANQPTTTSAAYLMVSIANGVTGGTGIYQFMGHPKIWQEI